MYKDKHLQKEANRRASQRRRDKAKVPVVAKRYDDYGMTNQGMTETNPSTSVIPKHGYIGAVPCTPPILEPNPKRGKDIKCFADLPPDVQQTIDKMSMVNGKIDKDEKAKRTAAAIKYQHIFPHRFEPNHDDGVYSYPHVIGKPGDADYNGVCTEAWRAERGR